LQDPRQYHCPASSSLWDDGDVKGVAKSNTMDVNAPLKELKMMQVPISEHTFCPTPHLYQGSSQNAIPSTLTINHEDALKIQQPLSSISVQNSLEPPHSPCPRT
jgi:THO complex subunit 2